jgi:hypothetical protein
MGSEALLQSRDIDQSAHHSDRESVEGGKGASEQPSREVQVFFFPFIFLQRHGQRDQGQVRVGLPLHSLESTSHPQHLDTECEASLSDQL